MKDIEALSDSGFRLTVQRLRQLVAAASARLREAYVKLLSLILRCYPLPFRERFESEMMQTLEAAEAENGRLGKRARYLFLARELLGLLLVLAAEWWLGPLIGYLHRVSALTGAIAVQSTAYGFLLPIGQTAAEQSGHWFFSAGAYALLLTGFLQLLCAVIERKRIIALGARACSFACGQQDFKQDITNTYSAAFSAMRNAKTKADLQQMVANGKALLLPEP